MKKDIDKILSRTLSTYVFILFLIFILKIVGLDYFGIDVDNPIIGNIDKFCYNFKLTNIIYSITLYINIYVLSSIVLMDNSTKLKKYCVFILFVGIIIKFIENYYKNVTLTTIVDLLYIFILLKLYNKDVKFKRYIFVSFVFIIYQCITLFIRNINYIENNSFMINFILSFDYIILQLISYDLYFSKGDDKKCGMEVYSSLQKQTLSLKQLKKYLAEFSNKSKQEKFEIILFTILSLLWNIFTVFVVLLIAKLNDTVIECIFILSSFWINKTVFGKAFHLDNAFHCFIVSNLTYYCLNRITAPIGISILIPIILGILLSYFTSKLVKDNKSKLYRGMPTDLFDEIILKVVNKNDIDYKICYMYYIEKIKEENIAYKVNYSKEAIQKHKKSVNDKIKRLVF